MWTLNLDYLSAKFISKYRTYSHESIINAVRERILLEILPQALENTRQIHPPGAARVQSVDNIIRTQARALHKDRPLADWLLDYLVASPSAVRGRPSRGHMIYLEADAELVLLETRSP